jgi:hypothetical protein
MRLEAGVVRARVGEELSDEQVAALIDSYAALARGVARYPSERLHGCEPALRSVPGPWAPASAAGPLAPGSLAPASA